MTIKSAIRLMLQVSSNMSQLAFGTIFSPFFWARAQNNKYIKNLYDPYVLPKKYEKINS
jgi:hypothetical protein